jgi:hypothetical protein
MNDTDWLKSAQAVLRARLAPYDEAPAVSVANTPQSKAWPMVTGTAKVTTSSTWRSAP